MRRASGSFELVASAVLLALGGLVIDRWLGITPALTVTFALLGFCGAFVKLYYAYKFEMQQHEAEAPWARRS